MLELKLVSALEKCFIDQTPADFKEINRIRMYKNGVGSAQLLMYEPEERAEHTRMIWVETDGPLAPYVTLRTVESVPNYIPVPATAKTAKEKDPGLLRTTPGLYPDVLKPLEHRGAVMLIYQLMRAIRIDIRGDVPAGVSELTIRLRRKNGMIAAEQTLTVEVIDTVLPEQETIVTQWFYADCLADYYNTAPFSPEHMEICRRFITTAVENGINMLLVPVFTPPLDTAVGGERTTTQLVSVKRTNGQYEFDFTMVDAWMNMAKECGIRYFEIAHLFTQWGAEHAPKVMAEVDGEMIRLFGWETQADGEEYVTFLRAFLTAFTAHLTARGYHDEIYFHLSDEPEEKHLPQYRRNKENIQDILHGWKILDAMSKVEFYREGLCEIPVAVSNVIEDFMAEDIAERWVYYCCTPWASYSNRFMAMHSARTRCIGLQMYKYGIHGFLHWGYNFYNNRFSDDMINPFLNGNAGYWAGGGDAVSVYPGAKGQPLESVRIDAFRQGLEDIRVLQLCEQYYGKDTVVREMEAIMGTITFQNCVDDTATMTALRDRMDDMIQAARAR